VKINKTCSSEFPMKHAQLNVNLRPALGEAQCNRPITYRIGRVLWGLTVCRRVYCAMAVPQRSNGLQTIGRIRYCAKDYWARRKIKQ
jgi:hypothetical protein